MPSARSCSAGIIADVLTFPPSGIRDATAIACTLGCAAILRRTSPSISPERSRGNLRPHFSFDLTGALRRERKLLWVGEPNRQHAFRLESGIGAHEPRTR